MTPARSGRRDPGRGTAWRLPRLFFSLAACSLLGACGAQDSPAPAAARAPQAGEGVSLISADGVARWLKDARGKAAVVNVWATWCPPCVAEIPELNAFYGKADPAGVVMLAVSVDDPSRLASTVVPFVQRHAVAFPVRVLENSTPDALGKALGMDFSGAVPVTLLFSPSGDLVRTWEGEVTAEALRQALGSA